MFLSIAIILSYHRILNEILDPQIFIIKNLTGLNEAIEAWRHGNAVSLTYSVLDTLPQTSVSDVPNTLPQTLVSDVPDTPWYRRPWVGSVVCVGASVAIVTIGAGVIIYIMWPF